MPQAVLDTSVLFAAAYRRDNKHTEGLPILRGIDDGTLPEGIIVEYVLAETLNGLVTHAGHESAVDFLDRLETHSRIHIERFDTQTVSTGKSLFRQYEPLSFVDACLVAYLQTNDLEYLYAFDDDFDMIDNIVRLDTPTNPYKP
jgi:predicted nucleic acid-binding protein